jgi:hypothetical protein
MSDPHVVALRYRLETDPSLTFANPPPCELETNEFTLRLADSVLTCMMKAHYASVDDARAVVEPVLRAWELKVALQRGKREMQFVFQAPEVIDRDPPPPDPLREVRAMATIHFEAVRRPPQDHYPEPPVRFSVSPDVETLWHRYEGYMQRREPLLSMVYACLTWLYAQLGGRENVAKTYAIDLAVLRQLDDFAANLGGARTARKFHAGSARREPTAQESNWIDAAIRMIIRRVGEHAYDPTAPWPKIRMSDLPPL